MCTSKYQNISGFKIWNKKNKKTGLIIKHFLEVEIGICLEVLGEI